ncbi:MAG: NAD(P)H-hydrate epimerase, partial [Pseudomonadota bacterium]
MTELLTAAQMRAIEQAAIEAGEVTGLELMERAGVGAADLIETWSAERVSALRSGPFSRRPKATILCGPGNNGGDGLVIARILKRRGWWVSVLLMSEPEDRHADAAEAARRWLAAVPQVYPMTVQSYREATGADVVVDALFGAGLNRPIDGELLAILNYMQHEPDLSERLVAIDGPSSICLDSGRAMSLGSMASLTITFHRPKVGHFLADGLRRRGRLEVVDIGLKHPKPEAAAVSLVGGRSELEELLMRGDLPPYGLSSLCKGARVERVGGPHKYDRGHALVLSGGVGRGGAARLAARGALR